MKDSIVRFNTEDLVNYGFDLTADRVVRFDKHPDGTYLNSRATYSINKLEFTHYAIRSAALKQQSVGVKLSKFSWDKVKWFVFCIALVAAASVTTCTVNVNHTDAFTTVSE